MSAERLQNIVFFCVHYLFAAFCSNLYLYVKAFANFMTNLVSLAIIMMVVVVLKSGLARPCSGAWVFRSLFKRDS